MQIIQGIRDKGAAIVIGVIALSLIGFILMDAKQGANKLFSSNSNTIGKINGSSVEQLEFNKRVKQQEDQQEQRSGMKPSASETAQIRDQVWNTIVAEKVFYAEAEKLGIDFTSKELSAILSSNDPENPLTQDKNMMDSATGKLDPNQVKKAFANIKKMTPEQKELFDVQVINPQKITSISSRYIGLLNASAYYPTWMQEKETKETKEFAQISYVQVPYTAIPDSTIKVTDDDVKQYVEKHKYMFKQEEGRKISYVAFSQLPNAEDSARIKGVLEGLKNDFAKDSNARSFIARNTSSIDFDSSYFTKATLRQKFRNAPIDSIVKLPINSVYGPYVDVEGKGGSYVLAKVLGVKTVLDSVKARHILIGTMDPQTRQPTMQDSVAKKLADSIYNAIKGGAEFATLAFKYSTDFDSRNFSGSRFKGGDLGFFGYGTMVPEFNAYSFNNPVGSKGVVHTMFGYHIIEIMNQKGSANVYKIGFMAKDILADAVTIDKASLAATTLASDKDPKRFDSANLKKLGLTKITVPDLIKENATTVGRLQEARALVRWAFDAKKGDISNPPYNIGDQFVVATVDKIMDEGLQDVETARPRAEQEIRKEKKAEEILKKIGSNPTLESVAAAYSVKDTTAGADSSLMFTAKTVNRQFEPKLVGATFNKENLNKVAAPLVGKFGVYVFKVNSVAAKAADTPEQLAEKKKAAEANLRTQTNSNWFDGLKNQATISDKRSKYY